MEFIKFHLYNEEIYFSKEYFESLLKWNFTLEYLRRCDFAIRSTEITNKEIGV
ncbi:MAG: hypothetical protein KJ666_16895 [Bacteroidetes bacterium]|nr:hypothetical protein [Bacteroidota bacterium]